MSVASELGFEATEIDTHRDRDLTYKAARVAISELRPTAAVALGSASLAVMKAAAHEGLRIPDDFSLIGSLVPQLAELPNPSLTNVDFPAFEMGQLGAQMLINRLAGGEEPPTQLLLQPPLTVRESTAPARRRRRVRGLTIAQ